MKQPKYYNRIWQEPNGAVIIDTSKSKDRLFIFNNEQLLWLQTLRRQRKTVSRVVRECDNRINPFIINMG